MTDRSMDKELNALKTDLAGLREEIAALAAGLSKTAERHGEQVHGAASAESTAAGPGSGILTDLFHKLDASRAQGEKVVRGLSAEVEQHPLVSIMAAFGLGYIIAKLWYGGGANEDTHDAA